MPERPHYNPLAAGNPFRKRGIDPKTGKPIPPRDPAEFIGDYLGPKAAQEVRELLKDDKDKPKQQAAVDLTDLLTPEEQAAAREAEQRELLDLLPDIQEQYKTQVEVLRARGYLVTLAGDKEGIIDIEGVEHVLPSLEQITERLVDRNKETGGALETKLEQGFKKLILVPFGLPLKKHIELHKNVILDHYESGKQPDGTSTKLLGADNKPLPLQDGQPPVDTDQPLWAWDEITEENMVYNPTSFTDKHGGVTKQELLKDDPQQEAFQLLLLQEDLTIPRAGQAEKPKAGRKQLEAGKSARDYLEIFTEAQEDPRNQYHLEQGLTPEAMLTLATTHLDETNQVLSDYAAKDTTNNPITSATFLTGAFIPGTDDTPEDLPYFDWYRDAPRARLYGSYPDDVDDGVGVRSAVRV